MFKVKKSSKLKRVQSWKMFKSWKKSWNFISPYFKHQWNWVKYEKNLKINHNIHEECFKSIQIKCIGNQMSLK